MMLVANKVTLTLIPLPGAVFTFQLAFAVVSIYMMKTLCSLRVDDLTWFNIKLMFPYTISFAMSIYANGKSLEHSNVETVIVARSCAPLLISVIEWAVLNRQLPSWKSTGALLSILVAATGYVLADSQMKLVGLQAYTWVGIYLLLIVYNMVYGKSVTSKVTSRAVERTRRKTRTYYTNVMSCPAVVLLGLLNDEVNKAQSNEPSMAGFAALFVSSAIGVGISWSLMCKFLSVLLNVLIWDKHATPLGIFWLCICLIAGMFYEPAALRENAKVASEVDGEPSESA
eukprot:g1320.t1